MTPIEQDAYDKGYTKGWTEGFNSGCIETSWKCAKTNPPKEGGRYWCLVEEQNDLGKSHFQWNCSYHEIENRWSDAHKNYHVIFWTELLSHPHGGL